MIPPVRAGRVSGAPQDPTVLFAGKLREYWRADTVVGGATPTAITDLSGNGRNLTVASGITVITSSTSNGWGKAVPVLNFVSGKATAATAAPGKPLHDGTGVTVWLVMRPKTQTNQDICFSTFNGSSSEIGCALWHDTTLQRIVFQIVNGDGIAATFTLATWEGSVSNNVPHFVVLTFASSGGVSIYVDGRLEATARLGHKARNGAGATLSTADPSRTRCLGMLNPSGNAFLGEIGECGVVTGVINATERAMLGAYAANRYGLTIQSAQQGIVLFDGNSLVDDYWRSDAVFPGNVRASLTRDALCLNRGVYGLRTNEMDSRAAAHVTPNYDSTASFNVVMAWEVINRMTETTKEITYAEYVAYCQARRAEGWKVVASTCCPLNNPAITQADWNWMNSQIATNYATFADALVRPDQHATIGPWAARLDTSLYPDGVHMSATAYGHLVPLHVAAINSVLP